MQTKKLGRGLGSLISDEVLTSADIPTKEQVELPLNNIEPNPNQPRKFFEPEKLEDLSNSIKIHGILQPLVVRKSPESDKYEIIAGERRWRAAQKVGLVDVPVVILNEIDERKLLELSLIENIQREDLNPIEKAQGYKSLIAQFNLTQEEAAIRVGQNRATVANMIRLLDLPLDIQQFVSRGTISMGHARALLGLTDRMQQRSLAERIIRQNLSVRDVEKTISALVNRKSPAPESTKPKVAKSPHIVDLEEKIMRKTGCRVSINNSNNNRGRISLDYADNSDFERILEILGVSLDI